MHANSFGGGGEQIHGSQSPAADPPTAGRCDDQHQWNAGKENRSKQGQGLIDLFRDAPSSMESRWPSTDLSSLVRRWFARSTDAGVGAAKSRLPSGAQTRRLCPAGNPVEYSRDSSLSAGRSVPLRFLLEETNKAGFSRHQRLIERLQQCVSQQDPDHGSQQQHAGARVPRRYHATRRTRIDARIMRLLPGACTRRLGSCESASIHPDVPASSAEDARTPRDCWRTRRR